MSINNSLTNELQEKVLSYAQNKKKFYDDTMKNNMNKFSVKLPTSIYIVTWNVCEMDVPNLDVLEELFDFSDKPEIVVVSLQEIDMSLSGIASGDKLNKGKGWGIGLHDALNRKGSYIMINMQQLGGVGLFLFIHENSMNNIGEVVFGSVACGVMKLANKGGIALSLKIGSTPILIIGSHLAAEKSNVEKRNNDFHTIINNLDLPHKYDDYSYVFWSGDLNYRLDLDDLDVLNICKTQCWSSLIKYDQLNNEIKKGTAFMKFLEAPIEFAPTYKVIPGSNNFVTSRGPAWCDRILFKTYQQIGITKYSSLNNIKKSDHIPVAGEFTIYPSKVNNQAFKQFEESLKKECLELEQYIKPNYNVSIEPKSFFISPFSSKKGLIHITNNGFTPLELIIFIEYEQTNHNDYVVLSERNVVVNINEIVDIDIEVLFNINCIPGPLETNSFIIVIKSNDNECK
ncbi:Type II inositol-1-1 [Entamoeba marina]